MDGACSVYGVDKRHIQGFGGETRRKETNRKLALTVKRISYSFSKLPEGVF